MTRILLTDDHSSSASEECTYLNVSTLELKFAPSPPPEELDITLFGRARFASQAIDIMKEELCNQCIAFEEARECAPTYSVHGTSGDVETYSAMDIVMKQASASQQDHAEDGDEVASCQREPSPLQSEVFQVQSLHTIQNNTLVVEDQHEKSTTAIESKSLSSAEGSSLSVIRSRDRTDCQKEPLVIGSSNCLNASLKRLYRSRNIPVPQTSPVSCQTFRVL